MANPGIINKTSAVETSIQAVVPVSIEAPSCARVGVDSKKRKANSSKGNFPKCFIFILFGLIDIIGKHLEKL